MSTPDTPPSEQELQKLREELASARAALGDFAYAVSHDLRANLRHITSYAALLREEVGPALGSEAVGYLETVANAARLMGGQIDGLMVWSQLDRVNLQPMALDTNALIDEARMALSAETAGRRVRWNVPPGLPRVHGDGALLRQLFTHLLSNALKFSRTRETAEIEIAAAAAPEAATDQVTLTVRDNGVGYNPAQQDKLFHVFQRLHSANQFEGLGLGLALARKIALRHGGSIRIEAVPDQGCCVSVSLPAADC